MALETATTINQLVATNPLGSDPIASGDDHIRLIKSTLKNTFPNVTGPVTVTHTELNSIPTANTDIAAIQAVLSGSKMIKQVVSFVTGTTTSTTGTTYVDTALTASITPTSTSSKILVICSASQRIYNYATEANTRLVRGTTQVPGSYRLFKAWLPTEGGAQEIWVPSSFTVVDSPATTSSVTYKVQLKVQGYSGGTVSYGSGDTDASSLILVEIL